MILSISQVQPEDLQVCRCPRYLKIELSTAVTTSLVNVAGTVDGEPAVIFGIPVFVFLSRPRSDDVSCILRVDKISERLMRKMMIVAYLGICLYLKPPRTQVAFASERINWGGIIIPDLLLLCIVSHAHSDVVIASTAVRISGTSNGS